MFKVIEIFLFIAILKANQISLQLAINQHSIMWFLMSIALSFLLVVAGAGLSKKLQKLLQL